MSTENLDLIRQGYEAFGRGDITSVLGIFDPNIHWHIPGRSPLSGDYKGHDEVIAFFTKTQELAEGTFSIEINDMLANNQRVVVLCTVSAQRPALVNSGGPCLARDERTRRGVPRVPRRPASRRRVLVAITVSAKAWINTHRHWGRHELTVIPTAAAHVQIRR
jgi:ketosteroid isomerase-like protein